MIYVFNRSNEVVHIMADLSTMHNDVLTEQLNGEYSYEFTVALKDVEANKLEEFNKIGFYKDGDFKLFTIREIIDEKSDYGLRTVYCEHDFYNLIDNIVEDKRVVDGDARQAVEKAIFGSDWQVGEVEDFGNKNINFYYSDSKTNLANVVDTYGGELRFRILLDERGERIAGKYVDLLHSRGKETGVRFEFGRNLESVTREVSVMELKTAMIGRGKAPETENDGYSRRILFDEVVWSVSGGKPTDKPQGQKWVGDPQAIAKYGVRMGVYEDESETPEELIQNTWDYLQTVKDPRVTYKASIQELSQFLPDGQLLHIGDRVFVLDEELDLMIEARIIQIERSLTDTTTTQVTIGNFYDMYRNKEMDEIKNQIDKVTSSVENPTVNDGSYPNTVPKTPTLEAEALFASIDLTWTYEQVSYYEYELYASQTKGFTPNTSNRVYRGKGSSYLHFAEPNQTWYYRVCGINSHGVRGQYSTEVSASTKRINDSTTYFEDASINSASIGSLNADVINAGKVRGQHLEMKGVTVIDGNGTKTLDIDSSGNIKMNVNQLLIKSQSIPTRDTIEEITGEIAGNLVDEAISNIKIGGRNYIRDYKFKKPDVWLKNRSAEIEINNEEGYGALTSSTENPWIYQILPKDVFKTGVKVTIQYEIKCEDVSQNTNTNSMLIRSQLTGYENDSGGFIRDVCILGQHENEVAELGGWTKCVCTGIIENADDIGSIWLRLYARNFIGKIYFRNVKLEIGGVPTDITPAPEDDDANLSDLKDSILSQVDEDIAGLQNQSSSITNRLDQIFNENVVSSHNKLDLKLEFDVITSQYETMGSMVSEFNEPSVTGQYKTLEELYNKLKEKIEPIFADMNIATDIDGAELKNCFYNYYTQYNVVYLALQTYIKGALTVMTTRLDVMSDGVNIAVTKSDSALEATNTIGKHFNFTDSGWVEIFATINGVAGKFKTQITDQKLAFLESGNEVAYLSNQELYITQAQILNSLQLGNIGMSKTSKGGVIYQWRG